MMVDEGHRFTAEDRDEHNVYTIKAIHLTEPVRIRHCTQHPWPSHRI